MLRTDKTKIKIEKSRKKFIIRKKRQSTKRKTIDIHRKNNEKTNLSTPTPICSGGISISENV